jgi:hypothetical protein
MFRLRERGGNGSGIARRFTALLPHTQEPPMTDLERLAECCESSAGPDDDLDREIWLTVVADDNQRELVRVGRALHGDDEAAFRLDRMMGGFNPTASLDAAMTLVPEGHCVSAMGEVPDDREWYVEIWKEGEGYHQGEVRGKTPALALTAAALRARSAMEGDE